MPKLDRPIRESDQSVMRPIALGIIQDVLVDRMALPTSIQVNFPGYTEEVAQPHGFISNQLEANRFPTSDKIFIEVTENYVEDLLGTTQTSEPDNVPIFLNEPLEVKMSPVYASVEMRISIHYRAKNKTEARRFYDFMMLKLPKREDTWLHELTYSFAIPEVFEAILQEIHRLQELKAPYNEDYNTFFLKSVNPRYGLLTDQAGKNTLGVLSETQSRCLGYFDYAQTPDFGARKDETDVWEVEIPYVVRYEKIQDVYFYYPIVIHNSVLSSVYRGKAGMPRYEDTQQIRTKSMHHMQSFESMANIKRPYNDFPGRYFPLFDEFMPRTVTDKTIRVFTALVLLDDPETSQDPLLLMNLLDLEDPSYGMELSDCIKAFIKAEREFITTPRASAVQLSLYSGRELMDGSFIEMDEDFNVRSKAPLSMRKYYHLRLSVTTDLTNLTEAAKLRLRRTPCALENILEYILPEGSVLPIPNIVGDRVTQISFDTIAENLRGRIFGTTMKTVQHTLVNAIYQMKK